jgi:hypothetical protein
LHREVGHQPVGGGAAADPDVAVERSLPGRHRLALGNADVTDSASGPGDFDRRLGRLVEPDALEDRMGPEASGQLAHLVDPALGNVRCLHRVRISASASFDSGRFRGDAA